MTCQQWALWSLKKLWRNFCWRNYLNHTTYVRFALFPLADISTAENIQKSSTSIHLTFRQFIKLMLTRRIISYLSFSNETRQCKISHLIKYITSYLYTLNKKILDSSNFFDFKDIIAASFKLKKIHYSSCW